MLRVLLIAQNGSLIASIKALNETHKEVSFHVSHDLEEAHVLLGKEEIRLLLIHVDHGTNEEAVAHLIKCAASGDSPCPVVVLADVYQGQQAISFFRAGAADYLSLPLDTGKLGFLLDVLTLRFRPPARPAAAPVPSAPQSAQEPHNYVVAPEIAELMEQVRRVAPRDITVLVTGETGTGKTRLARLIHQMSPRHDKPFLIVDCAALTGSLIESEMFGHARGAFTGADSDRQGKLAAVGDGTLVLDEINALPLPLQGKLLRAVEERVFEPVGSNRVQPLKARLIAVSNVPLDREVAAGRFRADLFYRLNVAGFYLPSLRDRPASIAPLCNKFLAEFINRNRPDITGMCPEVLKALEDYHWPGNIRELRNVIERAVALARGPGIELHDIPGAVTAGKQPPQPQECDEPLPGEPLSGEPLSSEGTLSQARAEVEIQRIHAALRKHDNNRLRAAAELGISRMGLYKKLHKYGLIDSETR
jgi:two-component system response regulator HydG